MPAMAIRVGVVWVALCLDDAKDDAGDALADDARSETRIGRPKQLPPAAGGPAIAVSRTRLTVLPRKQGTLHGVQGKTADPGFIVHWTFPPGLKKESMWLAYYVSLSRPRSFGQLLSHGLPDRSIIESGPPEQIAKEFDELFADKIATTKIACAKARQALG